MKVALLTREYPPEVYGGAGVHVEYLSRELATLVDLQVYCFGRPRSDEMVAATYSPWDRIASDGPGSALGTMSVDLRMAGDVKGADLVHSHTWYTNLGGHLAKLLHRVPHVMTAHSLEPLRPWKAEQLGAGYALSLFCERTAIEAADAVVAVSHAMRADVLTAYPDVDPARIHTIHNGIDPDEYRPDHHDRTQTQTEIAHRFGIDSHRPSVLFVGRITRQKGIAHLLDAAAHLEPDAQLILCAGAPDTAEIGEEMRNRVAELRRLRRRGGVIWIEEMLPRPDVIQLFSQATVFVCPSVYEPFGLINLEAMACEAPVVASATGGIPEIVVDGVTGFLVPFEPGDDAFGSPKDPAAFAAGLAGRINQLLADQDVARRFGQAGRRRVVEHFSWAAIARQTAALYRELLA